MDYVSQPVPGVSPSTTTASQPGGRLSELSGLLFNALIIVSLAVAVCLLVYCLCSWCKVLACRLCYCFGSDRADDEEAGGSDSRRRRRQHLRHRARVAPWSTPSSGRLFPAPPPSYLESVEQLGMPPTPPPGYTVATAVTTIAAAAAKSEADPSGSEVGGRPVAPGGHRSCPNIRLVAPAPSARSVDV